MNKTDSRAAEWQALRNKIGESHGDAIVAALRDLYTVFDTDMLSWMASLYDPAIGGFYYSCSARDTDRVICPDGEYQLLPDIESTYQALAFMKGVGLTAAGESFVDVLPESVKEKIGKFFYGMQDADGYFYHPQWGKNITISRQGRDLGSALRVLSDLGITPRYTPPTVGKSTSVEKYDISKAPERFRSAENYKSYLYEQNLAEKSYHIGSELLSQTGQIISYGPMIGADLVEITVDWVNANQNPDTGMWHSEIGYYGVNAIHKISQLYNGFGREYPNAEAAFDTTAAVIMSDVPVGAAVDVYNPWHILGALINNVRKFGENGESRAADMVKKVMTIAPAAIAKSKEKIALFKKPDGSFSYCPGHAAIRSQGAPVTVPRVPEGDVNGNCIATIGLVNSIYSALGLESDIVKIFTPEDGKIFVNIITDADKRL